MFDEKQLEDYRSVKASAELEKRVMKLGKGKAAKVYSFPKKAVSAVAACFAVIIAVGAFFAAQNRISAEIVQPDFQPASLYRSVNTSVTVQVDAGKDSVISVSNGGFILDGGNEILTAVNISEETCFEWYINSQEENILTVKKGLITGQYRLCFDEETQRWLLEEV